MEVACKTPVNNGQWHHCAFLRSGATIEIYLDGNQEGKVTGPHATGAITTDLRAVGQQAHCVAGRRGDFRGFTGAVDELCIFDRALKPEEIKTLAGR